MLLARLLDVKIHVKQLFVPETEIVENVTEIQIALYEIQYQVPGNKCNRRSGDCSKSQSLTDNCDAFSRKKLCMEVLPACGPRASPPTGRPQQIQVVPKGRGGAPLKFRWGSPPPSHSCPGRRGGRLHPVSLSSPGCGRPRLGTQL